MVKRQIILAPQALLPSKDDPQAATIEIDLSLGTIISIKEGIIPPLQEEDVEIIKIEDDKIVLPGLIDTHVHLNQPGRTEWEGFQTGTLAAISGGVTTLIDMPLNSIPPTTTLKGLEIKRKEALKIGINSDLGFWGGIIPGNQGELVNMLNNGVKGFKCFLIDSGVEEFPHVEEEDLIKACEALKGTNALILFHAELDDSNPCIPTSTKNENSHSHSHNHSSSSSSQSSYSKFLESRPEEFELKALKLIIKFTKLYPELNFHIVHLSSSNAIPLIKKAKFSENIKNLTIETCFHYLCLSSELILNDDFKTEFKCCPPIRSELNRKRLIENLLEDSSKNEKNENIINYIVSDHSPCIPELKKGNFLESWGGISSLGLGLSLLFNEIGNKIKLGKLINFLSINQAKQVNLKNKGELKIGNQADFIIFNPNVKWTVTTESLLFKNKISPYIGKTLKGRVEKTYLAGQLVWDYEKGIDGAVLSQGRLL
ncbi:allantoinase [Kwoniella pini CBS 10737]|uniref:allantoinase n=1 Tax=Kwoniella pini CBS 10737 TaxID=1296096 RepID=A0A1B9HVR9_9TREE|nr:allantoinase [Kwoniella pini CBS 10737]OCF47359.1 allantoinase [Kwoniella pini CBS 10737]